MSFATGPTGRLIPIPTTSRKVLFNGPHLTPLGTRRWSGIDRQHYRIAIGNVGSGRAALAEVGGERPGLSDHHRSSSVVYFPAPLPRRGAGRNLPTALRRSIRNRWTGIRSVSREHV